ncbi:hypothetical protein [[Erwinia] mediterraneensis]|uniref:hypothetical protein n=1 Tax=[Erwinia] mediterraneensis TaxID=2161819 RepID=UPI001030034A|nr:hypothetical protein [[Erwinia] mediterraneensis]
MRIRLHHATPFVAAESQAADFLRETERQFSLLKKEIHRRKERDESGKIALNSAIFAQVNCTEAILKRPQEITPDQKKRLHLLLIQYGMAALKCGDTDWESFGLAQEIFHNNEQFAVSNDFLPSLADLQKKNITPEEREYAWRCCQYNFACNITYLGMARPADPYQAGFSDWHEKLIPAHISAEVATAAINARLAEQLCLASLQAVPSEQRDPLAIALKSLNRFYDRYLQCTSPERDWDLISDGRILRLGMGVFLPAEIKRKLDLD